MSDDTASIVDSEVRRIVDAAYARATKTLNDKLADLHVLAKALLEYELLSGDEIKALLRGEPLLRDTDMDGPAPEIRSSVPKGGGMNTTTQGA